MSDRDRSDAAPELPSQFETDAAALSAPSARPRTLGRSRIDGSALAAPAVERQGAVADAPIKEPRAAAMMRGRAGDGPAPLFNNSHWSAIERCLGGLRCGQSLLLMLCEPEFGADPVVRELRDALPERLRVVEAGPEAATLEAVSTALEAGLAWIEESLDEARLEALEFAGADPAPAPQAAEGARGGGVKARLDRLAEQDRGVVFVLAPQEPLTREALTYVAKLAAAGRRATRERLAEADKPPLRGPIGAQILLIAPPEAAPALAAFGDSALRRAAAAPITLEPFDGPLLQAAFRYATGAPLAPEAARYALDAAPGHAALERLLRVAARASAPRSGPIDVAAIAAAAASLGFAAPPAHAAQDAAQDAAQVAAQDALPYAAPGPSRDAARDAAEETEAALWNEDALAPALWDDDDAAGFNGLDPLEARDQGAHVSDFDHSHASDFDGSDENADREASAAARLASYDLYEAVDAAPDLLRSGAAQANDGAAETGAADPGAAGLAEMGAWSEDDAAQAASSARRTGWLGRVMGGASRPSASDRLKLQRRIAPRTRVAGRGARRAGLVLALAIAASLGGALIMSGPAGPSIAALFDRLTVLATNAREGDLAVVTGDAVARGAEDASAAAGFDGTQEEGGDRALYERFAQGALGAAESAARAAAESAAPTEGVARELRRFADDLFVAQGDLDSALFREELAALAPADAERRLEARIFAGVEAANRHMAAGRFTRPEGANAYEALLAVHPLAPRDPRVRGALQTLAQHYDQAAKTALEEGRYQAFHDANRLADRIRARKPI